MKHKILIVEDDKIVALQLKRILELLNYEILGPVVNGEDAIELTRFFNPDLILMDVELESSIDGIATAKQIKLFKDLPVIYLTANANKKTIHLSKETCPYGFLTKPVREKELEATIELAIYKSFADKSLRRLNRLLQSNRSIDKLIVDEKNTKALLGETCKNLINTKDYDAAWISGGNYKNTDDLILANNFRNCFEKSIKQLLMDDSSLYSSDDTSIAEAVRTYNDKDDLYLLKQIKHNLNDQSFSVVILRIAHGITLYGYLTLLTTTISSFTEEELTILVNLSNDLAGSLHRLEIEKKVFQTEQSLHEKENYYRSLLHNADNDILVIDKNFTIVDANNSFLKSTGLSTKDIIGKKSCDVNPHHAFSQNPKDEESILKEVFNSGEPRIFRDIVIEANGNCTHADIELIPMKDENNNIRYVVESVRDITKLAAIKEKLNKSEEYYRNLFENAHDAIILIDAVSGCILDLNKQSIELYGYKKKNLIGKTIFDFCIEPDKLKLKINELNNSSVQPVFESVQINKAGSPIYLEVRASLTDYNNQKVVILSNRDISYKRAAEKELKILSEIVKQSPSTILLTDTDGTIKYVNPKFSELTGYSSSEALGQSPDILRNKVNNSVTYRNLWKTIKSGNTWKGEFINTKKNGEPYWASSIITPIKNENGEPIHYLTIEQDITDKKELEIELKLALNQANEINKFKTQLLGNMNHEVRTPLNAIMGYAQIIKEETTDKIGSEMSDKILKSSVRLLNTLNSIIELSDLEADRIKIEMSELNVSQFIRYIAFSFQERAKEKKLNIAVNLFDEDLIIKSDERILQHVLDNIVDNAIKYSECGTIEIFVNLTIDHQNNEVVEIKVVDSGIGIPESNQKLIFEAFRQSSEGITRQFEGTGLGLTISQRMIRLLHGRITVESEVGRGSAFNVYVPRIIT